MQIARAALEANAVDHSLDQAAFREDLLNIARTTLSSKLLHGEKDHFAKLAVDAVLRLKGSGNLDYIQVSANGSCMMCVDTHSDVYVCVCVCSL